jgi:hypothetical protein
MSDRPDYWLVCTRHARNVFPIEVPALMIPGYDDEPRKRVHAHVWIHAMLASRQFPRVEVFFKEPSP